MSANEKGIIAMTGRAHCQREVAFFMTLFNNLHGNCFLTVDLIEVCLTAIMVVVMLSCLATRWLIH